MNSPFDFFDKIYCINLPTDNDRWSSVSTQFDKVNILDRVEQIYVTPLDQKITSSKLKYPRGEIGVSLSQLKIIVHAISSNINNVLIFEDDFKFTENTLINLNNSIYELPINWNIFFLGGTPVNKLTKYSNNLYKTNEFYGAYAYALNKPSLLTLYDYAMDRISVRPYDSFTSDLSVNSGNGYVMIDPVCWPVSGNSTIRNGYRDYDCYIRDKWIQNT